MFKNKIRKVKIEIGKVEILLYFILLLFIADVAVTEIILNCGGWEMNAIMVPFTESWIIHLSVKMGVFLSIAIVSIYGKKLTPRFTASILSIGVVWYSYVLLFNITGGLFF